ncbi:MAG: HD family phosphohydrolase [Anaerolineae bacterium]
MIGTIWIQEGGKERRRLVTSLAFGAVLVSVLGVILAFQLLPRSLNLSEGGVSAVEVAAPRPHEYESVVLTEEARDLAESEVSPIYDPADPEVRRTQGLAMGEALSYVAALRRATSLELEAKISLAERREGLELSRTVLRESLSLAGEAWEPVSEEIPLVLDEVMRQDIRPGELAQVKRQIPGFISLALDEDQASVVEGWVAGFLVPNSILNEEATNQARTEARDEVEPVQVVIARGEVIVRAGDRVTPLAWEKLDVLGLRQVAVEGRQVAGWVLFAAILTATLIVYVHRLRPALWDDRKQILVLGLLLVAFALAAKLMVPGRDFLRYVYPLAAAPMLLAALLHIELGLTVAALLALMVGVLDGSTVELAAYGFLGGAVASLAVHRMERLNAFLRAGVGLFLVNVAVLSLFGLMEEESSLIQFFSFLGLGFANAFLATSLALGAVFLISQLLGITTPLQLMDLSRPTHPLLRELLLKAPGTYHHSLLLGNMAEQAAEAIGANSFLARVGAYYHDVGKLANPYYFVENQEDGVNPHDRMEPRESAKLVTAHVRDGLDLARKHSLPPAIRDFIPEHHGTARATYFYRKAQERSGDGEVEEAGFRYPGPRPRSRETAILMLADGVEAAVRSAAPLGEEEIDRIVKRIIDARLADGQLDNTNLTLRDLTRIRRVFTEVLEGAFHPRIPYPEETEKEKEEIEAVERDDEDEGGEDGAEDAAEDREIA